MFQLTATVSTMNSVIDPVKTLVEECKIHFEDDSISINAVDPANVGMLDLECDAQAFESYDSKGTTIGIDISRLADVISLGSSDDLVHIDYDTETRKVKITVDGLEYTLSLIDPDTVRKEPDVPDLDYPVHIATQGHEFGRAVTAAEMVSDHLGFGAKADEPIFYAQANGDTDDIYIERTASEIDRLTVNDDAESLFSLDYLGIVEKPIGSDTDVDISIGNEVPISLGFDIAEGYGRVKYVVAPRIQN